MRIAIGSDHGGFELKQALVGFLSGEGNEVADLGTDSSASVDYPLFAVRGPRGVASGRFQKGVLVCGTGIGVCIAANKVKGIRAALVHDETTARLAAQHNDANVLCLGGRLLAAPMAWELVRLWLTTPFEPRHQRRLDMISELERRGD
ncbi:MAG: ribose 5-phosphate isomerase B [Deltaproteobacteria bacterium]|nr:ribose 5-phosphate isomerase B [Deltaproteobacteria bacterium]